MDYPPKRDSDLIFPEGFSFKLTTWRVLSASIMFTPLAETTKIMLNKASGSVSFMEHWGTSLEVKEINNAQFSIPNFQFSRMFIQRFKYLIINYLNI